jgi:hypothetical protein
VQKEGGKLRATAKPKKTCGFSNPLPVAARKETLLKSKMKKVVVPSPEEFVFVWLHVPLFRVLSYAEGWLLQL